MTKSHRWLVLGSLLLVGGCSAVLSPDRYRGGEGVDGGPGMDSGPDSDSGPGMDGGVDASMGDGGPDAGPNPDDCDPVAQTGCGPGEKCTWDRTPGMERTTCGPAGETPIGGTCSPGTSVDACVAGSLCGDECLEICDQSMDSCGASAACLTASNAFTDRPGVGVCYPTCDPVAQACDSTQSCVLIDPIGFVTVCFQFFGDQAEGQVCLPGNLSCSRGLDCLGDPGAGTFVCTAYCALTGTGPTCSGTLTCVSPNDVYPETEGSAPANIGICLDCSHNPSVPGCS